MPDVVVNDGGQPFIFFHQVSRESRYKCIEKPPVNRQSNGQAESMAGLLRKYLKYLLDPQLQTLNIDDKVNNFLFNYRNTCLNNGQEPKTDLDLTNPKTHYKRQLAKPQHDNTLSQDQTDISEQGLFKVTAADPVYIR